MHLFPPTTGEQRSRKALLSMAIFAAVILTASTATADFTATDPDSDATQTAQKEAPNPFNGSFWELSLRGGPLLSSTDGSSTGWTTDIGLRNSFPFYLADHRLAYGYGRFSLGDHTAHVHNFHATMAVHPFYLTLLSEGLLSHFLSSLHLELGFGPRWGRLSSPDSSDESTDSFGITGSLGAGFDLPVTDPNQGRALWVNTLYRRNWTTLRFDDGPTTDRLHDHVFFLGLAWRSNGMLW